MRDLNILTYLALQVQEGGKGISMLYEVSGSQPVDWDPFGVFHMDCLKPSENTDVCIRIHNSNKITVMK